MAQVLRLALAAFALATAAPALAQALPKAVPSAGIPQDIPGAMEKPDPALQYRILFDVSEPNRDAAKPHQTFARAASMLNAMAANGVRPKAGAIAIVVHGAPDNNLLTDAAHMKRFGKPNPSRQLLEELAAAGVSVRICGQSYLARGYARDELHPAVQLDLMAMITIANLMAQGYGVVRDD
ncbi:MAG TPA: DsrE family protein [Novosphingobium sp.]|uniref:DsrE family protein n=1 Tax=Novosphingobium sp. 28-62-57 TaxID=1970409 RepID=UPI0025F957A8|nr:DsrE family protein [Novosphingobium sp. 28-62-57]HQS69933.1 DsrE family protein [Novosphingobium sp.]